MISAAPTPLRKRWQLAPPAPKNLIARLDHLPPLVVQILYNRGITDPAEVDHFLNLAPALLNPLQSPKLKGLDPAIARLRQAIHQREPIAVYGDYDVDGVTATALLVEALSALGGQAQPYIPNRVDEGYGLNPEALSKLKEAGVRVVVTVDCGVRSIGEVAFGNRIGLDLIVTDHHSTTDQVAPALACINPKQPGCPYPFKELSGVGLAFKLAQAMFTVENSIRAKQALPPLDAEKLLDLVALGTVADLVPLVAENRSLVVHGLRQMNQSPRPGIAALMNVARVQVVDAGAIGFGLGPRLNAAGRIEHAMAAYQLLTARDQAAAQALAQKLHDTNRERQDLTRKTQDQARQLTLAQDPTAFLLFAASPEFKAGVVGLAAARLTEEFYRPAVVVELGQEESRGSCRSIPEFHITQALDLCASLLVRHGGHAAAAGFTVRNENLQALAARLRAIATEQLSQRDLSPTLAIDCEWPLDALNPAVFQSLQQLEPCGYGNPTPLLCSRDVLVLDARTVGSEGAHLKLRLCKGRVVWDAIAFRQGQYSKQLARGVYIDIAYHLEENEWNGAKTLQLNVRDLQMASAK